MKRIWMLFLMAGLLPAGTVSAAVPGGSREFASISEIAGTKGADAEKLTLLEAAAGTDRGSLKITNRIRTGFHHEDGKVRYYEKGKIHTGFLKLKGKKYYFDQDGNMVTGEQKIGNGSYSFSQEGIAQTGFVQKGEGDSQIQIYYDEEGRLKTGIFQVDSVEYKASEENGEIYSVRNLPEPVSQRPELPTGCEITSWTMMANYAGIPMEKTEAADEMPKSADPNQGFVGSPYSSEGGSLVVFPGGLEDMTREYFGSYENMTGCTYEQLEEKLRDKRLVVVWVTRLDGFGSHTIALTGYDKESLYYNDPWTGKEETISREYFDTIWGENSRMAMSY